MEEEEEGEEEGLCSLLPHIRITLLTDLHRSERQVNAMALWAQIRT